MLISPASLYLTDYDPVLGSQSYRGLAEEVGLEYTASLSTYTPVNTTVIHTSTITGTQMSIYMRGIEFSPEMVAIAVGENPDEATSTIKLGSSKVNNLRVEIKHTFPIDGKQLVGVFPNVVVNPNFNPRLTPTAEVVYEIQFVCNSPMGLDPSVVGIWGESPLGYFKYL